MRIENNCVIAEFIKLTLPIRLPGNPCFPSGDLQGLRCFSMFKNSEKTPCCYNKQTNK